MKYPKKNHYLSFKRIGEDKYVIKHFLTEEEWEAQEQYVYFLKSLNGRRNPYKICPEMDKSMVKELLLQLKEEELLDSGKRFLNQGFGEFLFALFTPEIGIIHKRLGALWNNLLMVSWLPVFVVGCCFLKNMEWYAVDYELNQIVCSILAISVAMIIHELSHAAACIAYGGELYEMGILWNVVLPGAYVMIDTDKIKNKFKRMQVYAAGVEANLFIVGLSLCAFKLQIFDINLLLSMAITNFMIALLNICMLLNLDGMQVVSEIFGDDMFLLKALVLVFNKDARRMLKKRGISGKITIIASYTILGFQVIFFLVLFANILNIIAIFL